MQNYYRANKTWLGDETWLQREPTASLYEEVLPPSSCENCVVPGDLCSRNVADHNSLTAWCFLAPLTSPTAPEHTALWGLQSGSERLWLLTGRRLFLASEGHTHTHTHRSYQLFLYCYRPTESLLSLSVCSNEIQGPIFNSGWRLQVAGRAMTSSLWCDVKKFTFSTASLKKAVQQIPLGWGSGPPLCSPDGTRIVQTQWHEPSKTFVHVNPKRKMRRRFPLGSYPSAALLGFEPFCLRDESFNQLSHIRVSSSPIVNMLIVVGINRI